MNELSLQDLVTEIEELTKAVENDDRSSRLYRLSRITAMSASWLEDEVTDVVLLGRKGGLE
jgi:hypothetical protein